MSIAGEHGISMLDATECFSQLWCPYPDDTAVSSPTQNLHPCTTYEEGCLWTVSRFQGNLFGECINSASALCARHSVERGSVYGFVHICIPPFQCLSKSEHPAFKVSPKLVGSAFSVKCHTINQLIPVFLLGPEKFRTISQFYYFYSNQ